MDEKIRNDDLFARAFELMFMPVAICDTEGIFQNCNDAFCAASGYDREDLIGKKSRNLDLWAEPEVFFQIRNELKVKGRIDDMELRIKRRDGTVRLMQYSARVLTIDPEPLILSVSRDITERKKAQDQLSVSEVKYRRLFETSQDGILILDAQTGTILDVNPYLITLLSYSYDSFLGKSIWDIGFFRDAIQNKEKFLELQENEYVRYENLPLETSHGKSIEVEFVSNVYHIAGRKVIQCKIRDISDRRLIEEALKLKIEELDGYFNSALDLLCIANIDGYFLRLNPEWEHVLGYSIQDLEGRQFLDFVHPEDMASTLASIEKLRKQEAVVSLENRYLCKDGSWRWLEWRSRPKGNLIYAAARDITARREAEDKVKTLLAEKELILKEVHHRIKNYMSTIRSLLSLQAGTLTDTSAIQALEDAESRVQSMALLYDHLYRSVDFNEVSAANYLPALIDEILANFPNSPAVTVEKKIDGFILNAKKMQSLGIIINELLTNIMKYAFQGRTDGKVIVTASLDGENVEIVIEDNGNGIPENVDFENTAGFGLVLVNALTQQLGGEIHIDRNGGTKVILIFKR